MDDPRTITIARRFNGPPDSGNGGYVCGAFAVATGDDVRVRLMAPPPLDRALAVEPGESQGTWVLRDGDRAIASATFAQLQLDVPSAPPYVRAVWAAQHYVGFR